MQKVFFGLILCLSGIAYGMQYSPPSHQLMRQYSNYQGWLEREKKMHSPIQLALYISSLVHENVKALSKLAQTSETDLDYRVVSKDLPFDTSRKSFDDDVTWPIKEIEVRAAYANLQIQHLEMLKKEIGDERQIKIMSKL